ncbi:hydantoinase B/oxoprolinase family protein [Stakelama saccharophila]|uniref:Hydantoinase B/oxoprolinase family protein n=1 Tax=Stakelama saccharophila TaxID=3075605 RepID=A0ABZ0B7R8_9SPHN|nr:hydantoinase B/oxoprolinase family protein [Stakelama sp. W311]WNO52913.1 hydantoinase B/oxoprolinase family protein [Stakelama sp. W311]
MAADSNWQFWIDRGGTFTDVVAREPGGTIRSMKLLSENAEQYDDAAVEGIRRITAQAGAALSDVAAVKMGTTVATNALLEHKGEPTLLAITKGFGDALRIGYQDRPDLFAREIRLPDQAYDRVVEIDERVTADGEVLTPLDEDAARADLQRAYDAGLRSIAIVLMHGYRYTDHEKRLEGIARDIGFTQISTGHEVAALVKLVGRGETTVIDAYLSPVLRRYVDRVAGALGDDTQLLFMQSNGGLAEAQSFRGKDAILSGPAGGIVGMAATANSAGIDRVIGFDMGGTSTDVSHHAGEYERTGEAIVAGMRVRAPMLQIHTVAAGGGSICSFDGMRLTVGPESAGADPGPACYRKGGPLTVTDCNVLLGRIQADHFPRVFGPDADQPIDTRAVRKRFEELADEVERATGKRQSPEELAEGFLAIAVAAMANAIKTISVAKGHDLARYTLASFGGAGGQHACLVADTLGIDRVMIHPLAGVLSAFGMGLATQRVMREATVAEPLDGGSERGLETLAALERDASADLAEQGAGTERVERRFKLRYAGADSVLTLPAEPLDTLAARFTERHRTRFGFAQEDTPLVIDSAEVEAIGPALAAEAGFPTGAGADPAIVATHIHGESRDVPLFDREHLPAGWTQDGPAIVVDGSGTTLIAPGWRGEIDDAANLMIARVAARRAVTAAGTEVDPVRLELFNNLFMAIAQQMGVALQQTAYSVNIKERLDFSCAVFDRSGNLVANAPHMPVHLGSMGESIRAVMANRGSSADGRGIRRGDVYALNNPYHGGTHLPDVTVIMPVFATEAATAPDFYVAARGHQADIGGKTPGSMPSDSRTIEEEGILIDDFLLVDEGRFREADLRELLASGPMPARNPDQNAGDIRAQIAACARGANELLRIAGDQGLDVLTAYMGHVQDNAEEMVRQRLARISDGQFRYEMDNGAHVAVAVTVDPQARSARIDFTGSSDQRGDNFNAPFSIVRAALLYVARTLVDEDIPMNDGCLAPFDIVVSENSMLNPAYPAAVVAGNVEVSQVVTDALFGAFRACAAAQGTMNNFTFGDDRYQYYETICGGSGAGEGYAGTSAVQTNMTNSRMTDPEIFETRFPVLLEEFSIRRGSGGAGTWRGGDGTVRRIRFTAPVTASILSNRRKVPPFGLAGGETGAPGRNRVERADGSIEQLESCATVEMRRGDVFIIETPGGGGYGEP